MAAGTGVASTGKGSEKLSVNHLMVLILVLAVNVLNYVDRKLPFILAEELKSEFHLSDSEIGLLVGFAFALLYSVMSLPVARLADRYSPKNIIAASVLVWSVMTSLGGLAQNYAHLLLSRCGVAIGEAGSTPPVHALISQTFAPSRRAMAIAIFSLGVPLGTAIGLIAGGWLGAHYGWRTAFIVIGIPGVLLSMAIFFWKDLPLADETSKVAPKPVQTWVAIRTLASMRSYVLIVAGVSFTVMATYSMQTFFAALQIRSGALTLTEAGTQLGIVYGVAGTIGVLSGGLLTDWLGRRDERWYLWLPAIGMFVASPLVVLSVLLRDASLAIPVLVIPVLFWTLYTAPVFAIVQRLAPENMRAFASAVAILFLNILGSSLGPLLIGIISDRLSPTYGSDGLRFALVAVGPFMLIAAGCYFLAARTLRADLAARALR